MAQPKHEGDDGDGRAQPKNKPQRNRAVVNSALRASRSEARKE